MPKVLLIPPHRCHGKAVSTRTLSAVFVPSRALTVRCPWLAQEAGLTLYQKVEEFKRMVIIQLSGVGGAHMLNIVCIKYSVYLYTLYTSVNSVYDKQIEVKSNK